MDFLETIAVCDLKVGRCRCNQGNFFTIYFPGFVCFVLYLAKISDERLQDHWSSGIVKSHWWIFIKHCIHIHMYRANKYNKKYGLGSIYMRVISLSYSQCEKTCFLHIFVAFVFLHFLY